MKEVVFDFLFVSLLGFSIQGDTDSIMHLEVSFHFLFDGVTWIDVSASSKAAQNSAMNLAGLGLFLVGPF